MRMRGSRPEMFYLPEVPVLSRAKNLTLQMHIRAKNVREYTTYLIYCYTTFVGGLAHTFATYDKNVNLGVYPESDPENIPANT